MWLSDWASCMIRKLFSGCQTGAGSSGGVLLNSALHKDLAAMKFVLEEGWDTEIVAMSSGWGATKMLGLMTWFTDGNSSPRGTSIATLGVLVRIEGFKMVCVWCSWSRLYQSWRTMEGYRCKMVPYDMNLRPRDCAQKLCAKVGSYCLHSCSILEIHNFFTLRSLNPWSGSKIPANCYHGKALESFAVSQLLRLDAEVRICQKRSWQTWRQKLLRRLLTTFGFGHSQMSSLCSAWWKNMELILTETKEIQRWSGLLWSAMPNSSKPFVGREQMRVPQLSMDGMRPLVRRLSVRTKAVPTTHVQKNTLAKM